MLATLYSEEQTEMVKNFWLQTLPLVATNSFLNKPLFSIAVSFGAEMIKKTMRFGDYDVAFWFQFLPEGFP